MIYFCSRKARREQVLHSPALNGIDYLEVLTERPGCGKRLAITFLKDARALALGAGNIVVTGDTTPRVVAIDPAGDDDPLVITVTLDRTGDFSPYTLSLRAAPDGIDPPAGLDPQLSTLAFSFKAGCPSPADCLASSCCPAPAERAPDINYLAKDFSGFVQTMRDRMAVLTPAWTETHAADLGVALVETLAYAADHLSYQQDAVSTEAYIGTARSRVSLRRHARLVDYTVGEGCNARAWLHLHAEKDGVPVPQGTAFHVRVPGAPRVIDPLDVTHLQLLGRSPFPVFASLCDTVLYRQQNEIRFYTWSDANCCLPPGATEATLADEQSTLAKGAVLIFEEVLGPQTGSAGDADPARRWAVRLTDVRRLDDSGAPLVDPLNGTAITHITWSAADALPFPLCLSSTYQSGGLSIQLDHVSVARGNVVPADHGVFIEGERLGVVPPLPPGPRVAASCECDAAQPAAAFHAHARFHPRLARAPLTFAADYDALAPASAFASGNAQGARARIALTSDNGGAWSVSRDMLAAHAADAVFVPEIEYDGVVSLRFGDGQYGAAPNPGLTFTADYRIGNGSAGNVGQDTIAHMVWNPEQISSVRNPLAAAGGIDAESMEHIRQNAPFAFMTQARCVTEDDYGVMTAAFPGIRQARGTLRWTGSWYSAFVSVAGDGALTPARARDVRRRLELLRMLGVDVAVEAAKIVGLAITLRICVDPMHFRGDVYSALMQRFIIGNRCDGQRGLLDADNFVFAQTVHASPLITAAQAVDGVVSATLVRFGRFDAPWVDGVAQGFIRLGRLEIPHCDNDPDHLDRGVFTLLLDGGK
jgi:hypothetical protein